MSNKAFKLWFDEKLVDELGGRLLEADPEFDGEGFRSQATAGLDELEMMDRVRKIADAMAEAMPWPTERQMTALVNSLPSILENAVGAIDDGYRFWAYGEFIARYGLDDVDASFDAMVELTMRFSSEFAVRPFLEADVEDTLNRLQELVDHENVHVRRWVSEGTRSRLPWASRVHSLQDVLHRRIELLSALRHDPERYVQRSVANHLQDILKDDEEVGLKVLTRWASEEEPCIQWIVKHAARGLLKAGHPEVMALFGYDQKCLEVLHFDCSPHKLSVGDEVEIRATIKNNSDQPALIRVDFALLFPTKTGQISRKVFRWADCTLDGGQTWEIDKSYQFIHRSTRRVYPGEHRIEPIVNGIVGECIVIEVQE